MSDSVFLFPSLLECIDADFARFGDVGVEDFGDHGACEEGSVRNRFVETEAGMRGGIYRREVPCPTLPSREGIAPSQHQHHASADHRTSRGVGGDSSSSSFAARLISRDR